MISDGDGTWELLERHPGGQGVLAMLNIPPEFEIIQPVGQSLPWGPPRLMGVFGNSQAGGGGQPSVVLGHEWPISHELAARVSKAEIEQMHLEKYCTDHLLATGQLPLKDAQRGPDPPDFLATLPTGEHVRLDCTQLGIASRREANGLFRRLREAIMQEPRERFVRLRGLMIYCYFGRGATSRSHLPPRRSDRVSLAEFVELLAGTDRDEMLHGAPKAEGVVLLTAIQIAGAVPNTRFFQRVGFELGFNYSTIHSIGSFWNEVSRLARSHDKGECDELLITVSGPGPDGFIYPSEEAFGELMFASPKSLYGARHIKKITIHSWHNGAITQVLPGFRQIALPVFSGPAVPHIAFASKRPDLIPPGNVHINFNELESSQ